MVVHTWNPSIWELRQEDWPVLQSETCLKINNKQNSEEEKSHFSRWTEFSFSFYPQHTPSPFPSPYTLHSAAHFTVAHDLQIQGVCFKERPDSKNLVLGFDPNQKNQVFVSQ
jgi:hypothetical protein